MSVDPFSRLPSHRQACPRRAARAARLVVAVVLMLSGHVLAQPRLDPEERERLRHELREQAREERLRHRDVVRERRAAHDAGRAQPPQPPGEPGGPRWAPPPPPAWPDHRPVDAPHDAERPRRMSPEQREELRMMVRERRRSRE